MVIMYKKYCNLAAERKITQKRAWQLTAKELDLPIKWQELRKIHMGLIEINQPVLRIVRQLRKHYLTVILSKNMRSQFSAVKKRFPQVWRDFTAVINTWELGLPKASKKTILVLAKKFQVKPAEILYIDDQKDNLVEPKKLAVKTIFYKNFKQFKRELSEYINF